MIQYVITRYHDCRDIVHLIFDLIFRPPFPISFPFFNFFYIFVISWRIRFFPFVLPFVNGTAVFHVYCPIFLTVLTQIGHSYHPE